MPLTTAPLVLNDLTLTLRKKGEVTAAEDYRCQLQTATLTPSAAANSQTYDTFCDTHSSPGGSATWVLNLAGFQAYADVADLSLILFNDEGETYEYVLTPNGGPLSASNPGFAGDVTIIPTQIGGTAKQYATFTVDLPCTSKPTMITVDPVASRIPATASA